MALQKFGPLQSYHMSHELLPSANTPENSLQDRFQTNIWFLEQGVEMTPGRDGNKTSNENIEEILRNLKLWSTSKRENRILLFVTVHNQQQEQFSERANAVDNWIMGGKRIVVLNWKKGHCIRQGKLRGEDMSQC
jgi:hypothetical protein